MSDFPYKGEPMSNQRDAMKRAWKKRSFALFHEMGTGKTFTAINLAAARFMRGQIEAVLVICPTPIKLVWEEEVEKWCPVDYDIKVLHAGAASQKDVDAWTHTHKTDKLRFLVIGVEGLSQGKTYEYALSYAMKFKTMSVLDEASRIKNAKSTRTKRCWNLGDHSEFRLSMTGTPITQGIHDLFAQMKFLDERIIGLKSYTQFKRRYCVMGGFEGRQIIGYNNTNDLMKKIAPYVDVVKKHEVLDLPDKVYEKISVQPTKQQLDLIEQLRHTEEAEHQDEYLVTETVLERLTRFQQIIGGHFPFNEESGNSYGVMPIEGENPKIKAMLEFLEDVPPTTKVIIWARFVPEVELIHNQLFCRYGANAAVTFYGANSYDERKANAKRFINDDDCRFMVANPTVGGMGQTWVVATCVIYYSNNFSYEDRMQSEDRAHRKGQTNKVTYVDIEARHRYDRMILAAINKKQSVAAYVDERIAHEQENRNASDN